MRRVKVGLWHLPGGRRHSLSWQAPGEEQVLETGISVGRVLSHLYNGLSRLFNSQV